jgi:hypothetical protein
MRLQRKLVVFFLGNIWSMGHFMSIFGQAIWGEIDACSILWWDYASLALLPYDDCCSGRHSFPPKELENGPFLWALSVFLQKSFQQPAPLQYKDRTIDIFHHEEARSRMILGGAGYYPARPRYKQI